MLTEKKKAFRLYRSECKYDAKVLLTSLLLSCGSNHFERVMYALGPFAVLVHK